MTTLLVVLTTHNGDNGVFDAALLVHNKNKPSSAFFQDWKAMLELAKQNKPDTWFVDDAIELMEQHEGWCFGDVPWTIVEASY